MSKERTDLILRIQAGDELAFREFFTLYSGRLYAFALRMVKSPSLADDVVQEVFIRIWELRATLDEEKSIVSFLFKIARNHILNLFKRSSFDLALRQEIFNHAPAGINNVDDHIYFEETSRLLGEAIQRLPLQQRRVFELCKINGLSYEEAAAKLNISTGTVNTHIVKSVKFLKEYLRAQQQSVFTFLAIHLFL